MSYATASASAIGSGVASANSTAVGTGGGAAVAISTSSYRSGQGVMASATSPLGGPADLPAIASTKTSLGNNVSVAVPNALSAGQSFSNITGLPVSGSYTLTTNVGNAFAAGHGTVYALASMGAAYGGAGEPLTYVTTANFDFNLKANSTIALGLLSDFIGQWFRQRVPASLFKRKPNCRLHVHQSCRCTGIFHRRRGQPW